MLVWRFWQWTWILQKAYNLSRKYKDAINEYKVLANITMMTARLGKTKEARKYHKLLIKFKKSKDKECVFMWKFCMGMILYSEKIVFRQYRY